jgi:hypothetical protein
MTDPKNNSLHTSLKWKRAKAKFNIPSWFFYSHPVVNFFDLSAKEAIEDAKLNPTILFLTAALAYTVITSKVVVKAPFRLRHTSFSC